MHSTTALEATVTTTSGLTSHVTFIPVDDPAAPVLVIHSRLTRWEHRSFAATLQPIFMTMGAISVIAKTTLGSTGSTELPPWWLMPLVVVLVLIGVRSGEGLTLRVTTAQAKRLAMALAALGGASALVRGLLTL